MYSFMPYRIVLSLLAIMTLCGWPSINLGAGAGGAPQCTVKAQNSWNFDDYVNIPSQSPTSFKYQGVGQHNQSMYCGPDDHGVVCPVDVPNGGPLGSGAVFMRAHNGTEWNPVELRSDWRNWQNYQSNDELTISFDIKGVWQPSAPLGWKKPAVIWREGEFFTGGDNANGTHNERICFNLDPGDTESIVDAGGSTGDKQEFCGSDVVADNTGVNTTGAASLVDGEWVHITVVWTGGSAPNWNTGKIEYYVDTTLVKTESNIEGRIKNTGNRLRIGWGANLFQDTDYYLDNLQIDKNAWDADRVALAVGCDIPT